MMRMAAIAAIWLLATSAQPLLARDRLQLVGSEMVSYYSLAVSEEFARSRGFPTPQVLVTGNGGGFDLFCRGVGREFPDMVGSTRPMSREEFEGCKRNGVRNITEIRIGFKALVIATSKDSNLSSLTVDQLYRALAKHLVVDGKLTENPYRKWSDIDPALPADEIRIVGPAAPSELRDAVVRSMVVEPCELDPGIARLSEENRLSACTRLRLDGHLTEVRDTAEELALLRRARPNTLGVLWLSDWLRYLKSVPALAVDGVQPTQESIGQDQYAFAFPIFLYTKNQHYEAVPGLLEFVDEITGDAAVGAEGYLLDEGLIPLSDEARRTQRVNAIGLNPMWR